MNSKSLVKSSSSFKIRYSLINSLFSTLISFMIIKLETISASISKGIVENSFKKFKILIFDIRLISVIVDKLFYIPIQIWTYYPRMNPNDEPQNVHMVSK